MTGPGRHGAGLRLGGFSFHNCDPLRWGLRHAGLPATFRSPTDIAEALLGGRLDIAPISLVEYLRHSGELIVLPNLAIGCDGPVRSCHLLSRVPLDTLDGRPVALCTTSRTAAALTRVLLAEMIGVRPTYLAAPPEPVGLLRDAAAGVLIGDPALRAALRPDGLAVHDLGTMWRSWSGLPMVFAVWVVRRDVASRSPDAVAATHARLRAAIAHGCASPRAVAGAHAPGSGFTARELAEYYDNLDYTLGPRQLAGMTQFAKIAAGHGLVPRDVEPELLTGRGGA